MRHTHTHTNHVLLQSTSKRFLNRLATLNRRISRAACTVSYTVASSNMTLVFVLTVGLRGVASFIVTPLSCATAKGVVKATVVTTAVNIRAVYHAIKTIRMTVTHMERVSDGGEREKEIKAEIENNVAHIKPAAFVQSVLGTDNNVCKIVLYILRI